MNNQNTRWTAWHLHLATLGAAATDQVVRRVVRPTIDAARTSGGLDGWFFLRYWQHGPHVRLRLGGLSSAQAASLGALLQDAMSQLLAAGPTGPALTADQYRLHASPIAAAGEGAGPLVAGELWAPGVYPQPYHPEVDRYGGPDLMAESEALFGCSSELALAFLDLDPPDAARVGLGLRATHAALRVLAEDRREAVCQRAEAAWSKQAAPTGAASMHVPAAPDRLGRPVPAPVQRWVDRLESAMDRWRALGEVRAEQILLSHIHLLHNRLGLSPAQEMRHYRALIAPAAAAPAESIAVAS